MFERKRLIFAIVCISGLSGFAQATESLHVYGPGGAAPAMKAAPKAFGALHQVEVDVTARPTDTRTAGFKSNGDPIYSGSEATMSDFVNQFGSRMETSSIEPLYLQPAAILVRPGNLTHISVFQDLLNADTTVMVVHGAPTVHAFVAILHGPERYEK